MMRQARSAAFFRANILADYELDGDAGAMTLALVRQILKSGGGKPVDYLPKSKADNEFVLRHVQRSDRYMGMGFVEIAAECLGLGNLRYLTSGSQRADQLITRAFESTSDFPSIFENVLNKVLLARYELAAPTYRKIAVRRDFNDFRPHPQVRAFEFPEPQPVLETGELQYGTSSDFATNIMAAPYGVVVSISRQMLVNDELGAIDQILSSAGDVASVWENGLFYSMLLSNPVMTADSTPLFNSAHGNLASPGAAPSVTTYAAGRAALRSMKTPTGYYLNCPPRIILTGPLQETAAAQMRARIMPTLTTSANPFEDLVPISDANITDDRWYMICDQDSLPSFVWGYLKGQTGPRVRMYSRLACKASRSRSRKTGVRARSISGDVI